MNAMVGSAAHEVVAFSDYDFARGVIVSEWGDDALILSGKPYRTAEMQLLAVFDASGAVSGLAYYKINGSAVLLGAVVILGDNHRHGVGEALFNAVKVKALEANMRRIRAITTNDNFEGMAFYQQMGMRFSTLYAGGADAFRAFRTGIKTIGKRGLPLRDLIELELDL
jgi:GNAT superfamily N-acetyltransferase